MHGTLGCPRCGTANIALGASGCPGCGVQFAAAVVAPTLAPAAAAVAVAPAPAKMSHPVTATPRSAHATESVTYASIWARMGASGLDWCIFALPAIALSGWSAFWDSHLLPQAPIDWVWVFAWLVYVALMQSSSWQATLGMRAFDLRIQREDDFSTISPWRALGRDLLTYVSAVLLMIGYLMIAFTPKRQALHDKLAGTVVVHDPR